MGLFGSVRSDERRDTFGAFVTLLGFMSGHAILETARDALFLAELPVSLLPWVYLTLAACALLLTRYHAQLAQFFRSGQELNGWLVFAGLVTLGIWLASFWAGDWIFYLLYAWSGVIATLVVVQFWTMLSDRFTVTQAKRLFAVIGAGSVLGAILGSGAARVLTAFLPAQHLVLCAGLAFLATSFAPLLLSVPQAAAVRRPAAAVTVADLERVGRMVWGRPYLRRVAMAILLATVTFTLVDFAFKSTVARLVPDEQLGEFFSSVYFSLNIASLAIQVAAVSWILRHLTVTAALAIVPALLLLGAIGFIASAGLISVLLLKGADGALRYSLYRTTTELLFVPMSAEVRGPVKVFIDVLGQRGGQAIGSLLVLVVLSLTTNEVAIVLFAAAAAAAWLFLILKLKPHYLDLFRQMLREDINATKIDFPALDLASLETLLWTLSSPDDRKVIAALDLLADQSKLRVVPGLILYHPSPQVVIHALELFASEGRDDVLPLIDRLLAAPDANLRAASLRVRAKLAPDERLLQTASSDPSEMVKVTATVGLVAGGWLPIDEVKPLLEEVIEDRDPRAMLALARAIRDLPTPEFEAMLLRLTLAEDTEVQLAAIHAMRVLGDPSLAPALMALLPHRALRAEARAALVEHGAPALPGIGAALGDMSLPHAVRRHLPHVIAAFGSPQASAVLLRRLLEESDGMVRFKILRALGRMRTINPRLPLDSRAIRESIEQNMSAAFRFMRWRQVLEGETGNMPAELAEHHDILVDLLKDKQAHTLERLFRLLNLQANDEEFLRIYRGFRSARREAQAGSRELIEHLVQPPLRRSVLMLVDDLYNSAASSATNDVGRPPTLEQVFGELLEGRIESLSSMAAHAIGVLGMRRLEIPLASIKPLSPSHARIIRAALAALDAAENQGAPNG